MGALIVLSGPSCVGKSPLDKALKRFYADMRSHWKTLVLYNSRDPRPGEIDGVDYYFRHEQEIRQLADQPQIISMEVRGDFQALDLRELESNLGSGDVFFEGNPFVGNMLLTHPRLSKVEKRSVFMAPLSKDEIRFFSEEDVNVSLEKLVTDIMRRKLLRRTRKQKQELSLKDLENIEKRAGSAFSELKMASNFEWVIPNYDGEDSEHWDAFYYPIGSARMTLRTFVEIVTGKGSGHAEKWPPNLF
jgi:guanylate kinase